MSLRTSNTEEAGFFSLKNVLPATSFAQPVDSIESNAPKELNLRLNSHVVSTGRSSPTPARKMFQLNLSQSLSANNGNLGQTTTQHPQAQTQVHTGGCTRECQTRAGHAMHQVREHVAKVRRLESQLTLSDTQLNKFKHELSVMHQKYSTAQQKLTSEVRTLRHHADNDNRLVNEYKSKLNVLLSEKSAVEENASRVGSVYKTELCQFQKNKAQLETKIQQIHSECDELKVTIAQTNIEQNMKNAEHVSLQSKVDRLQQEVELGETSMNNLQMRVEAADKRLLETRDHSPTPNVSERINSLSMDHINELASRDASHGRLVDALQSQLKSVRLQLETTIQTGTESYFHPPPCEEQTTTSSISEHATTIPVRCAVETPCLEIASNAHIQTTALQPVAVGAKVASGLLPSTTSQNSPLQRSNSINMANIIQSIGICLDNTTSLGLSKRFQTMNVGECSMNDLCDERLVVGRASQDAVDQSKRAVAAAINDFKRLVNANINGPVLVAATA
jgi:myosin heavy subunit